MSPSEDDIEMLCTVIQVTREVAIRSLQANGNNVDRAINDYYDDSKNVKKQYEPAWDDKAFSAGREGDDTQGPVTHNDFPTFQIQGADETSNYQNSTNPTRPPSRAANRSPLGAPTTTADEDADLQRALAESAAQSGVPLQEVGVVDIDTNVKHFGPANRPDYQQDQWAMVPTKADGNTSAVEPPPSARKRVPGAPAFLRSANDHRLGAIISIYHSIPLVRNVLLSYGSSSSAQEYGSHMDWWKGQAIMGPAQDSGEAGASPDDGFPSFSDELQRLVAFLDNTDRCYGSADVLARTSDIDPTHGGWAPADVDHSFFEALKTVGEQTPACEYGRLETLGKAHNIFPKKKSTVRGFQVSGEQSAEEFYENPSEELNENMDEEDSDDNEDTARFILLDIGLNDVNFRWSEVDSLYDALDRLFWNHALAPEPWDTEDSKTATVEPSDVLTIRFFGEGLQRTCDIPAVLYVDRYIEERKNMAIQLQVHINQLRQTGLKGIENWKQSILECHHEAKDQEADNWLDESHGGRECWQKRYATLQEKIRLATEQLQYIESQMSEIAERQQQCLEALNIASKILTCRAEDADPEFESKYIHKSDPQRYQPQFWNPTHKYHLRGVATAPGIAYLFAKEDGDLMQFEGQPETEMHGQWWKVGYAAQDPRPITVEKITLSDVLVAAGSESKHPILVYATEAAYEDPKPVSQALRMFVQVDNRSFQQELSQEQLSNESAPAPNVPSVNANTWEGIDFASSTKRKHSRSSSLATLGSTGHCSDREMQMYSEDPFDDSKGPTTSHQEFASPAPQSNRLGGLSRVSGFIEQRQYQRCRASWQARDRRLGPSRDRA
ncbi:hypothetical protein PG989_002451 [Apiospora arundinis]